MNVTRHMRAFVIAAVPLFLIAGAAFASSGHPSLVTDPTAGPTAASTDTSATGTAVVVHSPDETKAPEASESNEPTKAPDPNESSEPTKAPKASDLDASQAPDKDGDRGLPGSSALPTSADKDGDKGLTGGGKDGGAIGATPTHGPR
jgi:hypothetical protein